jgi:hypothetical protein
MQAMAPNGMEIRQGVKNASPKSPSLRFTLTMKRVIGLNFLLECRMASIFVREVKTLKKKATITDHLSEINSPIKPKTSIPSIPPAVVDKMDSRKVRCNPRAAKGEKRNFTLERSVIPTYLPISSVWDPIFRQRFSPKAKSPASPNPGTIYDCAFNSGSMAPIQSVTFSGRFFLAYFTPSSLPIMATMWI